MAAVGIAPCTAPSHGEGTASWQPGEMGLGFCRVRIHSSVALPLSAQDQVACMYVVSPKRSLAQVVLKSCQQCIHVLKSAFTPGLPSYASRDSMPNLCDRSVKCKGRLFNAALGETVVDAGCFVVSCVSYF